MMHTQTHILFTEFLYVQLLCHVKIKREIVNIFRPDHSWRSIREVFAPSLGPAVKDDDELLSREAEQSVPSPAKRKRRLRSVNKGNISSSFGRNRKEKGRKVFPSQESDFPIDNPDKSMDGRSEGLRLSIDLNKPAQYNKQVSLYICEFMPCVCVVSNFSNVFVDCM